MKYVIIFIITWGLMFWLGNSRLDNGYDFIPTQYNLKGVLTSFILTMLTFGFVFLFIML